jgi:hypothetical protein
VPVLTAALESTPDDMAADTLAPEPED